VVNLDEACRRQQLGEGWFPTFEDVPHRAISMSVKQIMKTKTLICCVPDKRKSKAVFDTLNCEISPDFPASVMRNHPDTILFMDKEASSLL
jgi:glucosamine-6-phosphate deaminase